MPLPTHSPSPCPSPCPSTHHKSIIITQYSHLPDSPAGDPKVIYFPAFTGLQGFVECYGFQRSPSPTLGYDAETVIIEGNEAIIAHSGEVFAELMGTVPLSYTAARTSLYFNPGEQTM
jgi:hypothetical protein